MRIIILPIWWELEFCFMSLWIHNKILYDAFSAQFSDGWQLIWFTNFLSFFLEFILAEDENIHRQRKVDGCRKRWHPCSTWGGRLSLTAETCKKCPAHSFCHWLLLVLQILWTVAWKQQKQRWKRHSFSPSFRYASPGSTFIRCV